MKPNPEKKEKPWGGKKKKDDEKPQIGPKPRADAQVGHPSKPLQWKLLIKPPKKSKSARIGKRNK